LLAAEFSRGVHSRAQTLSIPNSAKVGKPREWQTSLHFKRHVVVKSGVDIDEEKPPVILDEFRVEYAEKTDLPEEPHQAVLDLARYGRRLEAYARPRASG